jgi:hypothetical protein
MAMLETLVQDGTVTLIAIAVILLELAVLAGLALSKGRRPTADLIANALSGLFLILALRAALVGSGAFAVAGFLGLSLVAHLVDMASRMRRPSR